MTEKCPECSRLITQREMYQRGHYAASSEAAGRIKALQAENAMLKESAQGYHDLADEAFDKLNIAEAKTVKVYDRLEALQAENQRLCDAYNDLLLQVVNKIPGESRHETARRIIHQHENRCNGPEGIEEITTLLSSEGEVSDG